MKQEPAKKEVETFYADSRKTWRKWLQQHHSTQQSIWLVYYKKQANKPTVTYSEAVDEALCFGWIDSTKKTMDDERFIQLFTQRKPKSVWSKINKAKIERLIAEGLMTDAGQRCIDTAQENGSWTTLDEVEELFVPEDLVQALDENPSATAYFNGLSKSIRKMMLYWLVSAKRPETRVKRISEIAAAAAQQRKPKQFQIFANFIT